MIIGEDENGERARAKVEVIADMPSEPPPVMEVRSELLGDERPRLVVGSAHSFASFFGAAHVRAPHKAAEGASRRRAACVFSGLGEIHSGAQRIPRNLQQMWRNLQRIPRNPQQMWRNSQRMDTTEFSPA